MQMNFSVKFTQKYAGATRSFHTVNSRRDVFRQFLHPERAEICLSFSQYSLNMPETPINGIIGVKTHDSFINVIIE